MFPEPTFSSAIDDYPARAVQVCDPVAKPGVIGFRDIVVGAYGIDGSITRPCASSVGVSRSDNNLGLVFDWSAQASSLIDVARVGELLKWLFETDEHRNPHARIRRHVYFIFSAAGGAKSTTWWTSQLPPNEGRSKCSGVSQSPSCGAGCGLQR